MPVELGYFTIPVPDVKRGKEFFGALFGWVFDSPPDNAAYAHVNNTRLPLGLNAGGPADLSSLYFRVDDIAAASAAVRALGGEAGISIRSESGQSARCTDDQGTRFGLWQPAPGL